MTEDIEDVLETIDYAIYNLENDLQKIRDKFDNLKTLVSEATRK